MLLGLVRPSDGLASVLGRRPGTPDAMRRIGFLPEHFRFPPWLTARDFPRYARPALRHDRRRTAEPVSRSCSIGWVSAGADGRSSASTPKGMQQRVGLAQALLNRPALVFLDEPTSGLDPVGRYEVREIIRELRGRGGDGLPQLALPQRGRGDVRSGCHRKGRAPHARRNAGRGPDARGERGRSRSAGPRRRDAGGPGTVGKGDFGAWRRQAGTQKVTLQITADDALPQIAAYLMGRGVAVVLADLAAADAGRAVHAGDGGGAGMNVLQIARITFLEARWRKIVWAVDPAWAWRSCWSSRPASTSCGAT